jgi:hypothetical protein
MISPTYKNFVRRFHSKVDREVICKPTLWNESLYEISNADGVRVVNLPHLKISRSKVLCCHIAISINMLRRLQVGNPRSD